MFPTTNNDALLTVVPLSGLVTGVGRWTGVGVVAGLALILPTVALAFAARGRTYAPAVWGFVVLALFVGSRVWGDYTVFVRLLLPLSALAVVAVGERLGRVSSVAGPTSDRRRPISQAASV